MKITKQQLKQIILEELYLIQSGQDHESVFSEELATIEQKKTQMIQRFMDPTNLNKYNLRPGSEPGEVLDMDGNPFLRIMPAQEGYEVGFYSSGKSYLYNDLAALETGTGATGTRFVGPPNLSDLAGTIPGGRFPSVTPSRVTEGDVVQGPWGDEPPQEAASKRMNAAVANKIENLVAAEMDELYGNASLWTDGQHGAFDQINELLNVLFPSGE